MNQFLISTVIVWIVWTVTFTSLGEPAKEQACWAMYSYNKGYIREAKQWQKYAPDIKIEYDPIENGDLDRACQKQDIPFQTGSLKWTEEITLSGSSITIN